MKLNLTAATRIGLNVLALLGVAVALYLGQSIFIPAHHLGPAGRHPLPGRELAAPPA